MLKHGKLKTLGLISFSAISIALLISSCAKNEVRQLNYDQDYCALVKEEKSIGLSKFLLPYQADMKHATGVYVLEDETESLTSRAWLSQNAEKTIDVQYFIFSTDNVGLIAVDYLVKAAEKGVAVRILVDDIMVDANGAELLKLAAHKNISIKIYNPVANIGKNIADKALTIVTNFHGLNQRMHNKTFTVDKKVTITGGRNVADEYFGYDHEYNFRDRDVLLLGKQVVDVQSSFDQFWGHELSVDVKDVVKIDNQPNTDYEDLHQYACNPENFALKVRDDIAGFPLLFKNKEKAKEVEWIEDIEYISDIPGKNNKNEFLGGGGLSTDKLISLAKSANKSVFIQTPYLITTDLGKRVLKELVDNNIEVKILTNSLASNDNLEAFSGYQRDRKALLKTGVKIYEFKPDAKIRQKVMSDIMQGQLDKMPVFGLHAKTMTIDDHTTVIGTFNLDPRSANLNTESITIIPSKNITKRVKSGMSEEMNPDNAWETTLNWNPDNEVGKVKQLKVKLRRIVPKSIL